MMSKGRQRRLVKRALIYFVSWIIISGAMLGSAFYIEDITWRPIIDSPFNWLPKLAIAITIILFNLASADIIRYYIEHHKRNTVAWTTAIIVFSPFLTSIAYFITWPKNQRLTRLD